MKGNKIKNKNGITLIALVITIIVMLILVAVTITMAINGGLFNYAGKATIEYAHATVKEALDMKNTEYTFAKVSGDTNKSLVEYLKEKTIITDVSEGKYKIEVTKLVGNKLNVGNGIKGKDVYMLENATSLAKTSTKNIIYNILYYNEKGESTTIGTVTDTVIKESEKNKKSVTELKYGDYVYYTLNDGTEKLCQVIYTADSVRGIEIMPVDSLCDLTFGYNDPTIELNESDNNTTKLNKSYEGRVTRLTNQAIFFMNLSLSPSRQSALLWIS